MEYTTGYIPDPNSFVSTDLILRKYMRIKRKAQSQRRDLSVVGITYQSDGTSPLSNQSSKRENLWTDLYNLIRGSGSVWLTSKILNGLPEDSEKIEHIMLNGGASQQHHNQSIRELSWLEENGTLSPADLKQEHDACSLLWCRACCRLKANVWIISRVETVTFPMLVEELLPIVSFQRVVSWPPRP